MRALLLALLLMSPAWADPLLDELKSRAPDKFFVMRENEDPASPIVALYGDLADPQTDEQKSVDAFVEKYGSLLGYPAGKLPSELLHDLELSKGPGHSFLRMPWHNEHLWTGGTIGFHFDKDHRLVAATNRYQQHGGIGVLNISALFAVLKAFASLKEKTGLDVTGDGAVYRFLSQQDDGSLKPMYKVHITIGPRMSPYTILVSGAGEVVCRHFDGDTFDAHGKTYDGYPVTVDQLDHALPRLRDAIQPDRTWTLDGDVFVSRSSYFSRARSKKGRFDFPTTFERQAGGKKRALSHPHYLETSMYYHLMLAHDAALGMGATEVDLPFEKDKPEPPRLGFDSWQNPDFSDAGGGTIDNAYYSAAEKGLFFGWWQPSFDFRHPAADPSVIYHEYGHYVHDRLNNYRRFSDTPTEIGDSGAISEGFADFFSVLLSGGSTVAEIHMGKERRVPSLKPAYCDLVPIYDGDDKDCYDFTEKGKTEIHDAANLFSGLALRLVQSGPTQLGGSEKEATARVCEAVRIAVPTTFRTFALSVMAVEMRRGDHARLPRLLELFREAGLFKTCGRTP